MMYEHGWGDVLDADGRYWEVLAKPDGSEFANGLYGATDGSGGQQYGENMRHPLTVVEDAEP